MSESTGSVRWILVNLLSGVLLICCAGELGAVSLGHVDLSVLSLCMSWLNLVLGTAGVLSMKQCYLRLVTLWCSVLVCVVVLDGPIMNVRLRGVCVCGFRCVPFCV